jgi:hypothetical protein
MAAMTAADHLTRLAYVHDWDLALIQAMIAKAESNGITIEECLKQAQNAAQAEILDALRGGDEALKMQVKTFWANGFVPAPSDEENQDIEDAEESSDHPIQ